MKSSYLLFALVATLSCHTRTFSQWTDIVNNNINYKFEVTQNYYNGANDEWEISEPVIKTSVIVDGVWGTTVCLYWNGYPPTYDQTAYYDWANYNVPFDTEFSTYMLAYESDADFDVCTYLEGDEYLTEGYGFLRDEQQSMKIVYPSTDFRPAQWIPYLGNGGNTWLYANGIGPFDQQMHLAWRYYSGWGFYDCLNFPNLNNNDIKSDINSNRVFGEASWVDLEYFDSYGFDSPDVWYSFTINENSNVTISTDHAETDFDSVIRLFNLDHTEIGYDDDNGTNSTSLLNAQLCAGTYIFSVEGYENSNGLFRVTVEANTIPDVTITNTSVTNTSCASNSDGSASWESVNALFNTDYYVNGTWQAESSLTDLPMGDYYVEVYAGCDSWDDWSFSIVNGDNTPPVAICETSLSVNVSPGNPAEVTVEEVDNGSGDNCSGGYATISPSIFDTFDEGSNVVTMTVTDSNGLTSQCICIVTVEVEVGMEEINQQGSFAIQPNPNNGSFRLSLENTVTPAGTYYSIFDITGRVISTAQLKNSSQEIELHNTAPGTYFISIESNAQKTTRRFIIE